MRRAVQIAIGIAVPALCLFLALRGAEWAAIGATLGRARLRWVALMAGCSIFALYVRAQRWRVLLRAVGHVPMRSLFSATAVGFMANILLPLRAGEVVRPYLLGRQATVSTSSAFASVVLERLFDMFLIFCFFLAVTFVVPVPASMRRAGYVAAAVTALVLVALVLLLRHRHQALDRLRPVIGLLPARFRGGAERLVESFIAGLAAVNDGRTLAVLFGYSFYLWSVICFTFSCGLLALDIGVPLVAGSLTLVVLVAAFVSLPQAPGYVGTWQAGCVAALAFYGVSREEALGLSLVTQAVQLLAVVGTGVLFLLLDNLRLVDLLAVARKGEASQP